ncbi:hypothetical protein [Brevibacillus sp. H7]|uniref:hypothetical protein n=1 Tax=Brevibacillus sp. H7 TaxID=3349138 RepID=UPI003812C252
MQLTDQRIREIVREEVRAALEERAAATTTAENRAIQFHRELGNLLKTFHPTKEEFDSSVERHKKWFSFR